MFRSLWCSSVSRALLAGAAAVVMAGCGSGVEPVTAPAPVAAPAPMEEAGRVTASEVALTGTPVASCDVFGVPYTLTASGSSYFSTSGSEVLICRGSVAETPPARGQVLYGFSCYLPQTMDYTTISQLVVNPWGGAVLRCQGR
jgi:hypothetical protein